MIGVPACIDSPLAGRAVADSAVIHAGKLYKAAMCATRSQQDKDTDDPISKKEEHHNQRKYPMGQDAIGPVAGLLRFLAESSFPLLV